MQTLLNELNPKQEEFCRLYTSDKAFFGNGVESYIEAYCIKDIKGSRYKTACSAASRLLTNVKILRRINQILEKNGLNDPFVDKQLYFLITQFADLGIKLGAIREYNKLKQRITNKSDITTKDQEIIFHELTYDDYNNGKGCLLAHQK